mmetsp:Transcript_72272/g.167475  ORF Transcript_72272/g.167475 Transcript_72272/m.167475 type:complete len:217 (+) Transcript_72272:240-890(+)
MASTKPSSRRRCRRFWKNAGRRAGKKSHASTHDTRDELGTVSAVIATHAEGAPATDSGSQGFQQHWKQADRGRSNGLPELACPDGMHDGQGHREGKDKNVVFAASAIHHRRLIGSMEPHTVIEHSETFRECQDHPRKIGEADEESHHLSVPDLQGQKSPQTQANVGVSVDEGLLPRLLVEGAEGCRDEAHLEEDTRAKALQDPCQQHHLQAPLLPP